MSDVRSSPTLQGERPAASAPQVLADQLALAAIAVNRTRMPMAVTDPRQADNPIVLANQAFLDLTGYSAEEVVGRNCRFLQGEETSATAIAELRSAVADAREFNIEVLNYRKDGSAFWNLLHVSPIYDDEGQLLYFFGSQEDVTEFRKVQALEATEHRLLMEVDHRARNALAVVNGIVRLTRADNAALYASAIQQRVKALAGAHTLLADGGWRNVALEQIIRQQLDGCAIGRVELDGPEILVSPLIVQPVALVLHELLFNATLHGSLSAPEGTLKVHWQEGAGFGGFKLRWQEANGPAPARDRRSGFGTAMMRGLIEKQLRGEIQRDWAQTGLVMTITVPGELDSLGEAAS